jgi:sarcosine oxidase subunit gamma
VGATLTDVSHLTRIGLKGPNAIAWLEQRGIAVPERANSWRALSDDDQDVVVRLGSTDFLIEASSAAARLQQLATELVAPISGVYPVLREDRAFVLAGEAVHDVLAEVCNVNFSALRVEEREAIMTLMIGVAVTVVPQGNAAQRRYRIWCDPSYADYLWSSLLEVARPYSNDDIKFGGIR